MGSKRFEDWRLDVGIEVEWRIEEEKEERTDEGIGGESRRESKEGIGQGTELGIEERLGQRSARGLKGG